MNANSEYKTAVGCYPYHFLKIEPPSDGHHGLRLGYINYNIAGFTLVLQSGEIAQIVWNCTT